jgi:hypothetical protein
MINPGFTYDRPEIATSLLPLETKNSYSITRAAAPDERRKALLQSPGARLCSSAPD